MRAAILIALLLLPGALGAEITGTAYTETLQVARFTILSINTTPPQRMLLSEGTYNLTVPHGTYLLQAMLRQEGIRYEDELEITVVDDGTYTYDLILFRAESNATEEFPDLDEITFPEEQEPSMLKPLLLLLLLGLLTALALILSRKQWWKRGGAQSPHTADAALADDLAHVLTLIRNEGGRTTQKELRRHLPYSEAKISMMITELEAKGKVQKIKKGRGNIIAIK